jgi:CRISPR-associated protein Cas2
MGKFADYALVYDISSDGERAKVDRLLKDFGFRVQKSVFECRLSRRDKEELLRRLKKLEIKTGFVKVYKLEFTYRSEEIGRVKSKNPDEGAAFIV